MLKGAKPVKRKRKSYEISELKMLQKPLHLVFIAGIITIGF
jgi:hypothetical protein